MRLPSEETATARTSASWTRRASSLPVAASQMRAVRSADAELIVRPSGGQADDGAAVAEADAAQAHDGAGGKGVVGEGGPRGGDDGQGQQPGKPIPKHGTWSSE